MSPGMIILATLAFLLLLLVIYAIISIKEKQLDEENPELRNHPDLREPRRKQSLTDNILYSLCNFYKYYLVWGCIILPIIFLIFLLLASVFFY